MKGSVLGEIQKLRRMSVSELQAAWMRLNHEPTRSRNKQFLFRRLAWRVQELAYGGLNERTRNRLDHLATDGFVRARTPKQAILVADPGPKSERQQVRDPRLPSPGTIIVKRYRGNELRLVVREDHFELDGQSFGSLSEAACHVTGSRWNGWLFWGLKQRSRKP